MTSTMCVTLILRHWSPITYLKKKIKKKHWSPIIYLRQVLCRGSNRAVQEFLISYHLS